MLDTHSKYLVVGKDEQDGSVVGKDERDRRLSTGAEPKTDTNVNINKHKRPKRTVTAPLLP